MMDLNIEKALEALDRLWSETFCNNETSSMSNRSDRNLIKQALTPPTAEEVCKALSEYFGFEYYYQDNFFYKSDGNKYIYPLKVSGFTEIQLYDGHLPPHLITLIGRFYENLNKEE